MGEDSERYHLKVMNTGREAVEECKAELFLVVKTTKKDQIELDRLHRTLGWLSNKQNISVKYSSSDLRWRNTVPGKETARIYLGSANGIDRVYRYPPSINNDSSSDQDSHITFEFPKRHESDGTFEHELSTFQNKEEFFGSIGASLITLSKDDTSESNESFELRNSTIETAEIRITSNNTAAKEVELDMNIQNSDSTLPELQIKNRGIPSYIRLFWNYRLPIFIKNWK